MSVWWRVSCEELGDDATESVLAPTAERAAIDWAEGRGTEAEGGADADAALIVDVVGETGNTGVPVGLPSRFELSARVVWRARRLG